MDKKVLMDFWINLYRVSLNVMRILNEREST